MNDTPVPAASGGIRIVRLFSRLNIGGPSIHVILLTAGLEQRGYHTRLVVGQESPHEGNMLALAAEKGVACEPMGGLGREIRLLSDFRALWGLYRLLRAFRPSIVHTHTAKAGMLGRLAARLAGVPVIVHTYHGHVLRGYFGAVKTRLFRALEAFLGRLSDGLVAVSEAVKQDLVDLGVARPERIRVVPLGLELEPLTRPLPRGGIRTEAGVPAGAPLVGMVGRLVPIKDVPTFLKAAALVLKALPACRFALIGDGEERTLLEQEVSRLGLAEAVSFCGWRRDIGAVYGDLDVVVNSSRNEGTPVALIEALAASRPVVATRVGGTPDLLGEGTRGLLVPPGEAEALAAAILETLRSPEAARRRALAGRDHVLKRHSLSRLIEDVDALYRELLASKRLAA
ncbi:MAG TPA: glycosyltransferase [Vicinamibacteria bacterium]|jgi:glycosyltransferase involved in cell wall biosynthesis|nr:glycosyltransferase [Vicinamibacteria bacterium]